MRGWLVLASLLTMSSLAPGTVGAQQLSPPDVTAHEVVDVFRAGGYDVSEPTAWAEGVVVFGVSEPAVRVSGRPSLRVFVFADSGTAAAEHRAAHARDEARRNRWIADGDDVGPQLLSGYGASRWWRNVALVQAAGPGDTGAFPVEPDCSPTPVITSTSDPALASRDFALPATVVETRFIEPLEQFL